MKGGIGGINLRLRSWKRETREVRWSTAAGLLMVGVMEAEERCAEE